MTQTIQPASPRNITNTKFPAAEQICDIPPTKLMNILKIMCVARSIHLQTILHGNTHSSNIYFCMLPPFQIMHVKVAAYPTSLHVLTLKILSSIIPKYRKNLIF